MNKQQEIRRYDPRAWAVYDVILRKPDGTVEVQFSTSDRQYAYNQAGELHRQDGGDYDVNSRPSARYIT